MKSRPLGKSGISVSPITLGTWAIGGWMWGGTDEKTSIQAIKESIQQGVTTIDTAPIYGMGFSEEIVGKAIQGHRNSLVIASKCGMRWSASGKDSDITRDVTPQSIFYECEESLKRLKIDVIDLYQIHWPDRKVGLGESWNALVQLKEQGKVRAIGVCNYNVEQLQTIHDIHPVDSVQVPYSLIRRGIEKDLIPFCVKNEIAVLVYSPLERGLLTGKFKEVRQFPEGDHRAKKEIFSSDYLNKINPALDLLRPIAMKHEATVSQIIMSATMHRNGITSALCGARNEVQAKENALAANISLSVEEREMIAEVLEKKELQHSTY